MRTPAGEARRARLHLLTVVTVVAWIAAAVVTSVPVYAGGSGPGGAGVPAAHTGVPAKPRATAKLMPTPAPTSTPVVNAKPSSPPRATPRPAPTPRASTRPAPTPKASATPTPTPSPKPTAKPHPTPAASPGGGNGAKATAKPPGQGTGGSSGSGSATGSGGSAGSAGGAGSVGGGGDGAPGGSGPGRGTDTFSVPGAGLAAVVTGATATGGGSDPVETEIYLDVSFAGGMDWLAPAAVLALPLLLIGLSLVAQLVGGVLWIPLTDRVLGTPSSRR